MNNTSINPHDFDTPEEWLAALKAAEVCHPNDFNQAVDLNKKLDEVIAANDGSRCALCNKKEVCTEAGAIPLCRRCKARKHAIMPMKAEPTQGRNERCKCGSGKKFKNCCQK